ncbi:PAS domain-containing protein [Aquihabitans sp. G128]|uniref:PAS domain-containing protein n=1 Tax=Aquihabitans sp. G128 TaxID=2849779 RepID=UPI001C246DA8|nr:PAS domain-containing protein [Aquihabitans sp. G128]QXC60916.1 PAS domain-containing protein [Aquihabitans sp. G128]
MTGGGATWDDDLGLAAALSDGVVVLGPGGPIVWANQAFCDLMGRTRAELLGSDGLGYLHPDELARAIDGIDYANRFPGRTSVAPYRVLRGDGTWAHIELKSAIVARADGDHLVLVVRDGRPRSDVNRALQSVAGGEPLAVTVRLVAEAIRNRWPGTAAAISIGVRGGGARGPRRRAPGDAGRPRRRPLGPPRRAAAVGARGRRGRGGGPNGAPRRPPAGRRAGRLRGLRGRRAPGPERPTRLPRGLVRPHDRRPPRSSATLPPS